MPIVKFSSELSTAGVTPAVITVNPSYPLDAQTLTLGVALINGTYAATATGSLQGCLDYEEHAWTDIASFDLSLAAGSLPVVDMVAMQTAWLDYRINLTSISGNGTRVKFIVIVKD